MPSSVSAHRLSGASVTSAPHTAWSYPPGDVRRQGVLAGVPAGAVPAVVAEGDGLGEGDVEAERPGHRRGDLGDLEGVGEPGALVVVGEHEHLRLAGQAAERRGVEDAVAVALEARPPRVGLLGPGPLARRRPTGWPTSPAPRARAPGGASGPPAPPAAACESAWASRTPATLARRAAHRRRPAVGPLLHRRIASCLRGYGRGVTSEC